MEHPLNFVFGWWLILFAFVTGALIGLGFHREEFLGGYGSFRRRITRLGHIALAALGGLNVLYGVCPVPLPSVSGGSLPGVCLIAGGLAMPAVCFLSAWREPFRRLFFIPVALLLAGVIAVLITIPR